MDLISLCMLVASAGAAAVAWWQAIEASRDRGQAEKARDESVAAQKATANSLEHANLIAQEALEAQRLSLPAPWGTPTRTSTTGSRYRVENTSGRTIVVTKAEPRTDGNVYVFIPPDMPTTVQYGDSLFFVAHLGGASVGSRNVIRIEWHFEGESTDFHHDERGF